MPIGVSSLARRALCALVCVAALGAVSAGATPYLVADADSGQVLINNEGTAAWYPASLTKLMTVYVALDAVRNGKLTLDTPLVMSARATRVPPSKMGFRPGTQVTLGNALKMLMVKSPNDVAVMVAEGVSGSVEAFANEMNAAAGRLGLHESHFVNPNGLHDPAHVSSARDMALIARALLHEFPEHADLFSIGALQLGRQVITNHNGLLGRYPGADGMKTGFTCPAGFNVVASANHFGRRLIVVVLGSPSAKLRTLEAAELFDRGFAMGGGSGSLDSLPSGSNAPVNVRTDVCLHRSAAQIEAAEEEITPEPDHFSAGGRGNAVVSAAVASGAPTHTEISDEKPHFVPVPVFVGPAAGWKGPVLGARPTRTASAPGEAKAYTSEKPAGPGDAQAAEGEVNAPQALQSVVREPSAHKAKAKSKSKPTQRAVADVKAPKKPANAKTVKDKNEKPEAKSAGGG